jgi:cell division transport system ATP-binding protein
MNSKLTVVGTHEENTIRQIENCLSDDRVVAGVLMPDGHKGYSVPIGVVFQDFKILESKNIFENIAISLKILGMNSHQIKKEVMETLALVNLKDKELLFPAQLSAGELQRVAIARAIAGSRDIILADEPTGNLDPKTTWEIMKIFKKLEERKTIIFATHNTDIVNSMKRRVIALKEGKIVKDDRKGGYNI